MAPAPAKTPNEIDIPETTPKALVELARSYSKASKRYIGLHKSTESLTQAPYRFAAIHAIELYLTAYLQLNRHEPKAIRELQHNLEERTARAAKAGLNLRKRTINHLGKLTSTREYVETRYHPGALKKLSQLQQLHATLNDVQQKVEAEIQPVLSPPPPLGKHTPHPRRIQVSSN